MKVLKIWTWRFEPLCLSLKLPRSRYFTSTHSCATIRKEVGEAAEKGGRRIPQFPLGIHAGEFGQDFALPAWLWPECAVKLRAPHDVLRDWGYHARLIQSTCWNRKYIWISSSRSGLVAGWNLWKARLPRTGAGAEARNAFSTLVFFGHLYIGWQETSVRITSLLWPSAVTIVHHGCQVFLQEVVNFQELVERTRAFLLSTTLHLVSAGVCWCLSPPPRPWT